MTTSLYDTNQKWKHLHDKVLQIKEQVKMTELAGIAIQGLASQLVPVLLQIQHL